VAQRWFDRGLNWNYAYNHEEAVACYRRAAKEDAICAMAWWGIAYASGPFYNRPWIRYTKAELAVVLPVCHEASDTAVSLLPHATAVEQALIYALAKRYQNGGERDYELLSVWQREYADAMRDVYRQYQAHADIAALFTTCSVSVSQCWKANWSTARKITTRLLQVCA
jgi:hypothetical protein